MFFLGILIGVGVYFIAMLIFEKFENIGWSFFGSIILFCLLMDYSSEMAFGMVAAIVVLFIIGYNMGKKQEEEARRQNMEFNNTFKIDPPTLPKEHYKNHCWNCGSKIDGSWNKKCPDCKKFYICPSCGACKCDFPKKPPFKH